METLQVDVEILGGLEVDVTLPINFISDTGTVAVNYSDGSPSPLGEIEAPGSVNIPQHVLVDTLGNPLSSGEYDDILVAPDGDIEDSQGAAIASVRSGSIFTFDQIPIKQQDDEIIGNAEIRNGMEIKGLNFNILSAAQVGDDIHIESIGDKIQYPQIERSVTTSYDQYDHGWWFINRLAELENEILPYPAQCARLDFSAANPFETLKENNVHGNTNRFVSNGDIIEDHLWYMEWINTFFANATRSTHLINAEANTTDSGDIKHWRLASAPDLNSIVDYGNSGAFPSIFPFTNTFIWVSDRYAGSSGNSMYAWGGQLYSRRAAGTYTYRGCYCRQGTWKQ